MSENKVLKDYQQQIDALKSELAVVKIIINRYSYARLIVFLTAIFAMYLLFDFGLTAITVIVIVTLICFLFLVKNQLKKQAVFQFKQNKLFLIQNEVNIITNKSNFYSNGNQYINPKHAYSDDLDVFGSYSIYGYINRCSTVLGTNLLANWLIKADKKNSIEQRQHAVAELENYKEDTLNYRTRLHGLAHQQVAVIQYFFDEYLDKKLLFLNKKTVKAFIFLTPIICIGLLAASIIFGGVFWSFFGLTLLISGTGTLFFKKEVDLIHEHTTNSVNLLNNYADNLKWIEGTNWQSELLIKQKNLLKNDKPLYQEIKKLSKILNGLNARLNLIVGVFLNLFFQWDLRCLQKLNIWEKQNEAQISSCFKVISEFEALISLAVINQNHLDWVNPVIYNEHHFETKAIGHPLIEDDKRITNNFSLQKYSTIDVITGSNMAGKSTFLRTIGVNMVLAFAGAKVCANLFETSIFNLLSYMRIKDSLNSATSTFKAEIDRLKMILDVTALDNKSFVLVDEMLRGTNSKDKYLGSKVFIEKLIAQKTPGFIATHDLQIAELESDYPLAVRNFNFDIQIHESEMFFDYKIKDGECKTFNAAILLKAIGLKIDS